MKNKKNKYDEDEDFMSSSDYNRKEQNKRKDKELKDKRKKKTERNYSSFSVDN